MSLAHELLARMPQRPIRQGSVVCATAASPGVLAKFYLDGDQTVMVPGRIKSGSTFTPGQAGLYDWASPSLPICYRTA